mmetsp:Transcript_20720/g.53098  ORF Transcript_20720/g.53098 Transcript_20720/m.53098 type:complete len:426 (+) Transcript_20720:265-1542(+)
MVSAGELLVGFHVLHAGEARLGDDGIQRVNTGLEPEVVQHTRILPPRVVQHVAVRQEHGGPVPAHAPDLIVVPETLPRHKVRKLVTDSSLQRCRVARVELCVVVHEADGRIARVAHDEEVLLDEARRGRVGVAAVVMHAASPLRQALGGSVHPFVAPLLHRRPSPARDALVDLPKLALQNAAFPRRRFLIRRMGAKVADLLSQRRLPAARPARLSSGEDVLALSAESEHVGFVRAVGSKRRHRSAPDLDKLAVVQPAAADILDHLLCQHLRPSGAHLREPFQQDGGVAGNPELVPLILLEALLAQRDHRPGPAVGQVEVHIVLCAVIVLGIGVSPASGHHIAAGNHDPPAHALPVRAFGSAVEHVPAIKDDPKNGALVPGWVILRQDAERGLPALSFRFPACWHHDEGALHGRSVRQLQRHHGAS